MLKHVLHTSFNVCYLKLYVVQGVTVHGSPSLVSKQVGRNTCSLALEPLTTGRWWYRYKDLVDDEDHERLTRVLTALEKKDEMQQRMEAITKSVVPPAAVLLCLACRTPHANNQTFPACSSAISVCYICFTTDSAAWQPLPSAVGSASTCIQGLAAEPSFATLSSYRGVDAVH